MTSLMLDLLACWQENWNLVSKKWEGFLVTQFITTTTSQVSMKVMLVFTIFNNELFLVTHVC
mgnify:FL=1